MKDIIRRADADEILKRKHWLLVYGRRKVGKTFLLRELCKLKNYYVVRRDLSVITENGTIPIKEFVENVKKLLRDDETAVVDEFQRLDEGILEELAQLHPKGRLILSGSSLRVVKKIFEPHSPLLGFFTPSKIGFIRPSEMVHHMRKEFEAGHAVELATFLREPWIIPLYDKGDVLSFVYDMVVSASSTITALLGEVFTEEERELSKTYEALLSSIGSGVWHAKELASLLYARHLIPDASTTRIIQYLKNLEDMELIEGVKLHGARGTFYRLLSPLMNIYYYLDSRYDLSRQVSLEELRPTLEKLIALEVQNFIAELFAEKYGGRKEYFVSPDKEIDFIITVRNKPVVVGEVKWTRATRDHVARFEQISEGFGCKRVLICKQSGAVSTRVEVLTANQLVKL